MRSATSPSVCSCIVAPFEFAVRMQSSVHLFDCSSQHAYGCYLRLIRSRMQFERA